MRINRFLARCGIASRRKAEAIVLAGRVSKNGETILDLATDIEEEDRVCVDGHPVQILAQRLLLAYHKPRGLLCSHHDPFGAPLIYEQLPKGQGLFSIGRLDRDSEGLLLITNEGKWAQQIAHPSHETEKEYIVVLNRPFAKRDVAALKKGMTIEGEHLRMDDVHGYRRRTEDAQWESILPDWPPACPLEAIVRVTLHEGHKREIRRLFSALCYNVLRLVRIRIDTIALGNLPPGQYRRVKGKDKA